MENCRKVLIALLLALIFVVPPAGMLQHDSSRGGVSPSPVDESGLTNEQGANAPTKESTTPETPAQTPAKSDVNVEGDRSSKKFLNAFKLNFDPFDPEDGETVNCTATVHNFGSSRQIAHNVNVEFWYDGDNYIGTAYIDEIDPGENGTASVNWKAIYGSHTMKVVADPDGSDGGPDSYETTLNVTRSTYSVGMFLAHNASWIKNSNTNDYYIKVTNRGSNSDTIDLSMATTKYGNSMDGWTISLDQNQVTLDGEASTYVKLSVKYLKAIPDYTAEAVVKVTAQSEGDSTRNDVLYTTTDVVHDVPILYVDDDGQHSDQPRGSYNVISGQYGPETDDINIGALDVNYHGLYHHVELQGDYQPGGSMSTQGPSGPPYDSSHGASTYNINGNPVYLKDYDVVIWDTGYSETLTAPGSNYDGSGSTHSWYDQTELETYLKNGGSLIWLNNKGTEWHDPQAGIYTNPLYTDYFKAERCVQQGGLSYNIVGVTNDPVGNGIDVKNSFI